MTSRKHKPVADIAHALPESRGDMLRLIKRHGALTAGELAAHLHTTREAARQQLKLLEQEGWIVRAQEKPSKQAGRPAVKFAITPAGDHLFPKRYDDLSMTLVDAVAEQLGPAALTKLLTALTDQQVRQWEAKLAGKSLIERIHALKGIYFEGDPYISIEQDQRGYLLVEHNCPYLNLAMQRPRLCSVTVSTLTRLLGVRVVREKRFQNGDQRCAFRVLADQPVDTGTFRFAFETS
ncbi:MAG TPA: MarR family transcriptional regulator [Gammaproteobacteria bacterium]|nr:MarR family transcriptional regulator [Gammaproteobacteria bacterium]